jgi:puromycin-sensitive aminopeptidase
MGDDIDERVADAHDVEPGAVGTDRPDDLVLGDGGGVGHDGTRYRSTVSAPCRQPDHGGRFRLAGYARAVPAHDDPYRLPRHAVPTRYDVELAPDLAAASFTGSVRIEVRIDGDVDDLTLNAVDLAIHDVTVDGTPATHRLDTSTERLTITPATPLAQGATCVVTITFTGTLNDLLKGFYRSTYRSDDGTEHVIATSQMQATDCRRAFPCWDEPDFKAVFGVTLVVDDGLLAISNGAEVERQRRDDGKVAVRFADTMPMSTYLVAFVVGPLEATEPIDVRGVPMRIVHVPGKSHLTSFGLDVGRFCLGWFQDYYGIAYPSDKVDLVALPDFAAGAMENLGCITFRENLLLVDPAVATQAEQELVADVVAHELAHMWFGDLVTMSWWNGIWLNEAFATFMEIAACDHYRPDWQRWTSFGLERSVAFETDSLHSTRPVEFEVRSPADADGMFDVLTYQKGGALLRMLEQFLGEERFREGVNHYLRTHAHGNTETSDLWDAIEATSKEPVRRVMDSWIWQRGYPLVTASLDGATLVLRQQRFSFDAELVDATEWLVPVTVRAGGDRLEVLLDSTDACVDLPDDAVPIVVNAGGHGFYRVAYDDVLRSRLLDHLAELSTLERYNLVDDTWSSVVAGHMPVARFIDFAQAFTGEREFAVWQALAVALRSAGRLLDDDDYPAFQRRVAELVRPAVVDLGEPVADEGDLRARLRGLLVGLLAVLGGDADAVARCRAAFEADAANPGSVDPELLAASTSVVAATGGAAEFERLLDVFRTTKNPQTQLRHLYALAEFDDPELIRRACELAASGEVKTQNAPFLLRCCIANRRHGSVAWRFVREHWDELGERFPANLIVRMIDTVRLLNTGEALADVQGFFSEQAIPQSAKTLDQILERQRVNAALRADQAEAFAASLR